MLDRGEFVADYLDRHGVIGFPTKKMVEAAREEWQELQDNKLRAESEEARAEYLDRQRGYF